MGFISDIMRANRASKAGRKKAELKQLEQKNYKSEKDNKKIQKLSGDIERLKELNKIASEKNSRIEIKTNSDNKTITQNNGVNTKLTYNSIKTSQSKKKK